MTALEQLLKEELEKERKYSQKLETRLSMNQETYNQSLSELKTEYLNSLKDMRKSLEKSLNNATSLYKAELEKLCKSDSDNENLENDLEKRLTALEMDLSSLKPIFSQNFEALEESLQKTRNNQIILHKELESIKNS